MIIEKVLEVNSFLIKDQRIYEVVFIDENGCRQVKRMDSISCLQGKEWIDE